MWKKTGTQAQVAHNGTGVPKLVGGTVYTPNGGLNLTPGANNEWSVVRWTAIAAGNYAINAHFFPRALANAKIVSIGVPEASRPRSNSPRLGALQSNLPRLGVH